MFQEKFHLRIIVIGMLLRRDYRGISSIVSTLRLEPKCYDNLIHFFRSKAFELSDLMGKWVDIVAQNAPLLKVADRLVVIGDNASNVAFEEAAKVKDHLGNSLLTIIVRAKANFVAFEPAIFVTNKRGRGRPAKYGKKVNLKELFESRPQDFQTAKVSLYGKLETIQYLCLDLQCQ
jgi:hypothetical protein